MDSEGSSGRRKDGVFWAIPSAQEMLFFRYQRGGCAVYPEVLIKPASWGDRVTWKRAVKWQERKPQVQLVTEETLPLRVPESSGRHRKCWQIMWPGQTAS